MTALLRRTRGSCGGVFLWWASASDLQCSGLIKVANNHDLICLSVCLLRLLRNRVSAQQARERKKNFVSNLQELVSDITDVLYVCVYHLQSDYFKCTSFSNH